MADPILGLACQIAVARYADRGSGLKECLADRKRCRGPADTERTALSVKSVLVGVVVLRLPEIRKDVLMAPTRAARLSPLVKVEGISPGIDLGIDGGSSAQHPCLSEPDDHVLHVPLRNGVPTPTADALGHLRETGGYAIEGMPIPRPRLQQKDPGRGVLRKSGRQNTSCRPAADDDEIVRVTHGVTFKFGRKPGRHRPSAAPSQAESKRMAGGSGHLRVPADHVHEPRFGSASLRVQAIQPPVVLANIHPSAALPGSREPRRHEGIGEPPVRTARGCRCPVMA